MLSRIHAKAAGDCLMAKVRRMIQHHRSTDATGSHDATTEATAPEQNLVRLMRAREKGQAWVCNIGLGPEDMMKPALCWESVARCLGPHCNAQELGGKCHGTGFNQRLETVHTRSYFHGGLMNCTYGSMLQQAAGKALHDDSSVHTTTKISRRQGHRSVWN